MTIPNTDMVCILGATAIGKTGVAVALARLTGGEVISADSRQVYRGMDIGTGKDLEEYESGGPPVPYHLIDIVDPGYQFNLFEYQQAFLDAYAVIRQRSRLPILCGGTGLYLEAVLKQYRLVPVAPDPGLRRELERESDDRLGKRLSMLRVPHNTTDTSDRERLIRAVEIAHHSHGNGCEPLPFPEIRTRVYGLRLERTILRRRISDRLEQRLRHGLVEEVRGLLDDGLRPEQLDFYGLEYRFVTRYLMGELTREEMVGRLTTKIHKFAKRQETWFRRMEKRGIRIGWLDGRKPPVSLAGIILEGINSTGGGN